MRMVLIKKTLKIIYDYLNGRSQKIKVGSSFSSELDISCGVPQGSIFGILLLILIFVIFLFSSLLTLQTMLATLLLTNVINTVTI